MRKTVRICCFALGTALLLAALFLVLHNLREDRQGGEAAERVLDVLKQEIPEYAEQPESMQMSEAYDLYAEYEEETAPEMETIEIDGNVYIGYIAIPSLDIELPVLAEWSYPHLKIAPCRYVGDLYAGNLVICAHNYSSHFGRLKELHSDDVILFTDATGKQHCYTVVSLEEHPGTAVEEIKLGNADEWDLTLFTCTLSGQSRVTVRAAGTEE